MSELLVFLAVLFIAVGFVVACVNDFTRMADCREKGGTYIKSRCLDVRELP